MGGAGAHDCRRHVPLRPPPVGQSSIHCYYYYYYDYCYYN